MKFAALRLIVFSFILPLALVACSIKTQSRDPKTPEAAEPASAPSAHASLGPGSTAAGESNPTSSPSSVDSGAAEKTLLAPVTFSSATVPVPVPEGTSTKETEPTVMLVPKSVLGKKDAAAKSEEAAKSDDSPMTEGAATAKSSAKGTLPVPPPAAKKKGPDAKTVVSWLKHGNTRFLKGGLRKDGQSKKDIQRLANGQQPHTIVISCSDSRVPPEIIFDQKLGELFVIRTVGESLDENVIASVEFALRQTGAKLILIMGHTSCGAVNAAIQAAPGTDAGSPALNHLIADIQPRIQAALSKGKLESDGAAESLANAKGVGEDLKMRSEFIRSAVASGDVVVQTAIYQLKTGEVKFE